MPRLAWAAARQGRRKRRNVNDGFFIVEMVELLLLRAQFSGRTLVRPFIPRQLFNFCFRDCRRSQLVSLFRTMY